MQQTQKTTLRGAIAGAGLVHWLVVAILTLGGMLVAELPIFPRLRDRVYLWLQTSIYRPERRVVVVAIDDQEFWRGPLARTSPLNRSYLAALLEKISAGDPDVIALDVGLETAAPEGTIEQPQHLAATLDLLHAVDRVARKSPVVLPKTIYGAEAPFRPGHDVYDSYRFHPRAEVRLGHTSAAKDIRQIPTRVSLTRDGPLDSFALAIVRATGRGEVPKEYDSPEHAWPFSQFFPQQAFAPTSRRGRLLTPADLRAASAHDLRQWFRGKIVIVGGMWHTSPDAGADARYVDERPTPAGRMAGVVTHANYVQSLLIGPMFPMPDGWRVAIEIVLSLGVSLIFLRSHGWKRARRILLTIGSVILLTWMFRAAIGVFFDLVIPVTFLGVHVLCEELSERFQLVPRSAIPHGGRLLRVSLASVVVVLAGVIVSHEISRVHHQLQPGERLQVVEATGAPVPGSRVMTPTAVARRAPPADPPPVTPVRPREPMQFAGFVDVRMENNLRESIAYDREPIEPVTSARLQADIAELQREVEPRIAAERALLATMDSTRQAELQAKVAGLQQSLDTETTATESRRPSSAKIAAEYGTSMRSSSDIDIEALLGATAKRSASPGKPAALLRKTPSLTPSTAAAAPPPPCTPIVSSRLSDAILGLSGESRALLGAGVRDASLVATIPAAGFTSQQTLTTEMGGRIGPLIVTAYDPCIAVRVTAEYARAGGDAAREVALRRAAEVASYLAGAGVDPSRITTAHAVVERAAEPDGVTVVLALAPARP